MGDSSPDSLFLNPEIFGILKHHVLFENHEKEQPYFEKRANLNRHIRRIYENITPFQCRACEERFPDNSSLRAHITSVHEGKKLFKSTDCNKLFQCTTCGIGFTLKGSLNKHMVKIHNQLRSYKCRLCDSSFDEKLNLKIHKCLGRKDGLNQHVETVHVNKKPAKSLIKCGGCDVSFLDQKALRDHFTTEHPTLFSTITPKRL